MHTRGQRFLLALQLRDPHCWDSSEGHAYKQFLEWGFDVSVVEDSEFSDEDIRHGDRILGRVPTKRTEYSVSNSKFDLRFTYVFQDFSKMMCLDVSPENPPVAVNMFYKVDDQNAFDYWLDERIYQGHLNLCIPDETVDPSSGSKEVRVPLQDGVARHVTKLDGSSELSMPGKKLSILPDGSIDLHLDQINKVRIENILDLKSYSITKNDERTFHIFEYNSGENGEITYGPTGRLEVFHAQGRIIVGDGEITLFGSKDAENPRKG